MDEEARKIVEERPVNAGRGSSKGCGSHVALGSYFQVLHLLAISFHSFSPSSMAASYQIVSCDS